MVARVERGPAEAFQTVFVRGCGRTARGSRTARADGPNNSVALGGEFLIVPVALASGHDAVSGAANVADVDGSEATIAARVELQDAVLLDH